MKRAERHQLGTAIEIVRAWVDTAREVRQLAAHLALSGPIALDPAEMKLLQPVEEAAAAGDVDEASRLAEVTWFDGRKKLQAAHRAAERLLALEGRYQESASDRRLVELRDQLAARAARQRQELDRIVRGLVEARDLSWTMLYDAYHLPITRAGALSRAESTAAESLIQIVDENREIAGVLLDDSTCTAGTCSGAHVSATLLKDVELEAEKSGFFEQSRDAAARLSAQLTGERTRLGDILTEVEGWDTAARQALADVAHLPLTRAGALSESEHTTLKTTIELVELNGENVRALLDPAGCAAGVCQDRHHSGALLSGYHAAAQESGAGPLALHVAERVASQLTVEQQEVAELHALILAWPDKIDAIRRSRVEAAELLATRPQRLLKDSTAVKASGATMKLLPLLDTDEMLVASLALLRDAPLTDSDESFLNETGATAKSALTATKVGFTARWKCRSSGKCLTAHEVIPQVHARAVSIEAELDRLTVDVFSLPRAIDLILEPSLGFMPYLGGDSDSPELLPAATTERSKAHLAAIVNAASAADEAAAKAHAAAEAVRASDVANALKAMDLEVLRKASQEKIRVAPLENYDLHSVWDVLQFQQEYRLASLTGLGDSSARAITQATLRLFEAVRDETPVRIDVKRKAKRTVVLLESLRLWDVARRFDPTKDEVALSRSLTKLFQRTVSADRVLAVTNHSAAAAPPSLTDLLTTALDRIAPPVGDVDTWTDFLSRPSDYFGMLTELGFMTEDEKKMHGDLPEEIVEAVRAKELNRDFLTASLRAYQSFGARFALVQEKVVIGDEMGLGKTVEALAVFTHLRATGQSHFLVVCPAAVVSNWVRETAKHTKLTASRLHGPLWERNYSAKSWVRNGGVAVTTYDLLPWALDLLADTEIGCAVFDEAHYIKNPLAKRSIAAAEVIDSLKYALLMTGTPLENSVQEFRNLVGYLRPDLSDSAPEYLASKFRKHVAPAYLRRNQEDVLTELPELVEIDEWMGMSDADERAYRTAVQGGHFMLMRRTAMLSEHSLKVERLLEIVEEAEANGRRVIVFSYFREVLAEVARLLPGEVFGPLTGSTPAADRQALVDRFSDASDGAVLVAQVTAGGVGLNIQSASVVVICEPQLKPTTESQAIARTHRMGQTNTVQVHRLLSENSVDERIREILAEKRRLFDEFARDSVIAKQAPDAVDMSDAELARVVIAAERERLFGDLERPVD